MKYLLVFAILVVELVSCAQEKKQEDLDYRVTSQKFLQLISRGEIDSAKKMFIAPDDDDYGINNQLMLIKRFLDNIKFIPDYDEFILDSLDLAHTQRREYTIKLFKGELKTDPENFVGEVSIIFFDGTPERIITISAIAKPSKL
jgi:hypothetical protein